jgi:hypothetical protein
MAYVGKQLDDEEIISYILAGLPAEYDSIVFGAGSRTAPLSL